MTFVFQAQAAEELNEALDYIQQSSQKSSELFVDRVQAAIDYILRHPDSNMRGRHGTFRRKIYRHPYWLIFRRLPSNDQVIEIVALVHERRGDEFLDGRFKDLQD